MKVIKIDKNTIEYNGDFNIITDDLPIYHLVPLNSKLENICTLVSDYIGADINNFGGEIQVTNVEWEDANVFDYLEQEKITLVNYQFISNADLISNEIKTFDSSYADGVYWDGSYTVRNLNIDVEPSIALDDDIEYLKENVDYIHVKEITEYVKTLHVDREKETITDSIFGFEVGTDTYVLDI